MSIGSRGLPVALDSPEPVTERDRARIDAIGEGVRFDAAERAWKVLLHQRFGTPIKADVDLQAPIARGHSEVPADQSPDRTLQPLDRHASR